PRHEVLDAYSGGDLRGNHRVLSCRYHLADALMLAERIEALLSPCARSCSPAWQFSKSPHNSTFGPTLFNQQTGPHQVRRLGGSGRESRASAPPLLGQEREGIGSRGRPPTDDRAYWKFSIITRSEPWLTTFAYRTVVPSGETVRPSLTFSRCAIKRSRPVMAS